MKRLLETEERHIVPRWRGSIKTLRAGELAPLSDLRARSWNPPEYSLDKLVSDWSAHKSIGIASELVGAAFSLGLQERARDAALFLLDSGARVPGPARRIAAAALGLKHEGSEPSLLLRETGWLERENIRDLRSRLRSYPRDPIGWVDLARGFVGVGLNVKAARAMVVGLSLAPTNRFTLRSAARFYIHLHEPERAHHVLWKSGVTQFDPWLVAAEIAVSDVAGRTSRLVKFGRSMLGSGRFSASDTSELASAIASLELSSGNSKLAKKLFGQALIAPTDNSVAQAEWATRKLKDLLVPLKYLEEPLSFEARAIQYYLAGDWELALRETEKWQGDESFSSRPPALGTFIAAVVLDNHEACIQIADRGRLANPDDFTLLNNRAFSLASLGRIEEAEETLAWIQRERLEVEFQAALAATRGLIKFRRGLVIEGRSEYLKAIEIARAQSNRFDQALAAAFLLREEVIARSDQIGKTLEIVSRESTNLAPDDRRLIELLVQRFAPLPVSVG